VETFNLAFALMNDHAKPQPTAEGDRVTILTPEGKMINIPLDATVIIIEPKASQVPVEPV